jgi:putative ABC transport system permease protein
MLLQIAFRNLIRRSKKNAVIAILIAVGVGAFFTGNALLESSIGGIRKTFSDNFTADLSVSERTEQSFSLFGPDIPVIGAYESEPVLLNAADAGNQISRIRGVAGMAYVISSPVLLEVGKVRDTALALGVIGEEYFSVFPGPKFIEGSTPASGSSGWVVISDEWATRIAAALGRLPTPGDALQFSFFHDQTFTIREATLAGVIRYTPDNDALKNIVIMDGRVLRELCGYAEVSGLTPPAAASVRPGITDSTGEIDSLFSSPSQGGAAGKGVSQSQSPVSIKELQKLMSEAGREALSRRISPLGHDGAWHFILIRVAKGVDKDSLAAAIRKQFAYSGLSVQVRDWRGTAGAVALYVYFMQIVLYIGIVMLGGIVLILTINSVVMSVFERTAEIGTMRAIGAQKEFIRGLFVVETGTLTLFAGAVGILLGLIAVFLLNIVPLHLTNQILVLLFGGNSLQPSISLFNIVISLVASVILGLFAWIYPVRLALKVQPIRAMHSS